MFSVAEQRGATLTSVTRVSHKLRSCFMEHSLVTHNSANKRAQFTMTADKHNHHKEIQGYREEITPTHHQERPHSPTTTHYNTVTHTHTQTDSL